MSESPGRFVIGITGASGAPYARRTVQLLAQAGADVHLVVSALGHRLMHDELGMGALTVENILEDPSIPTDRIHLENVKDVGATIACGAFKLDGMIVVPCSSNSLAGMATGLSQNLLHRAAYVTLKERRRLVLVHRESPLTLIDLRHMETITQMGGIIMPASPGFYLKPTTIEELVDFVAGRALDLVGVKHELAIRWDPKAERSSPSGARGSAS